MEQNPFNPSEGASSGESKDNKKSGGFNVARSEQSPEPARVERVAPAAPALERVISLWDRSAEEEHRRTTEESAGKDEGGDEGEKSKESSKKEKDSTKAVPPVTEVRPFQSEATEEAADETSSEESGEAERAELRETLVNHVDEGENPADDTHAPRTASTPRAYSSSLLPFPPIASNEAAAASRPQNEYAGTHRAEEDREDRPDDSFVQAAVPVAPPNVYPLSTQPETTTGSAQEQADDDNVPAPHQPVAAGGGLPPVPPAHQPAFAANQPPDNPNYAFANQYTHPGGPMAAQYNMAPNSPNAMPNAAPVMPIEHPLQTYNRDPGARQAAAILGVGLWAEHRGRKKADRRLEKADQHTEKLVEQQGEAMAISQRQMQERQRQMVDEQERQAAEMQRMRMSQERFTAPPAERFVQPQPIESAPNAGPVFMRGPETQPVFPPLEQPKNAERPPIPAPNAEQQAEAEQVFQLDPHQRVEHSAWHNIVVDERGHEVAGAIQYGEGFQRERQQEVIRDRMGDSSGQSTGSGAASGQYQQDQFGPTYPGALPSGMTNPTLPQGKPTHVDPQHQLEPHNSRPTSEFANPWLWIMIVLIIAAFFTAALV
jgi:hypothetical protein